MAIIGTAHVVIRAITDKIESDIDRALSPAVSKAGDKAGRDLGNSISSGLSKSKADLSSLEKDISRSADKISKQASSKMKFAPEVDSRRVTRGLSQIYRDAERSGKLSNLSFIRGFGQPDISPMLKRAFAQVVLLTPVVGVLVGALSSLVSGLFAVGSAVASAANSLAILPGILGAVATGIGGVLLAFGGIGAAFSAGNKAIAGTGGSSKAANKSANQLADAQERASERIAEAYERAAERTEAANEAMARAQERLQDVIYDNAKNLLKAQRDLRDAEEGLADAQAKSLSLQGSINRAREEAISRIKELQFSVEGAAISEGKAAIALERAREKLAEVNELPVNHRLRREAELNYRQAQLDLDQAKKANEDLAKEQEESNKAGVEGSKEVVEAKQDQIDAARDLRDAEEEVADARQSMAETEIQNSRDLRDARKEIADVEKEMIDIQKDLQKAISDANKDLAKSMRDVGAAAGGGGAAGGINAFNAAMAKLSPEAQRFVRYLLSVQDEFKRLRNEAGKELFPKLEQAIGRLINGGILDILADGLRNVGSVIGDVAIKFANLTADPFFQGNFASFMQSNAIVLGSLGDALINVSDLLTTITAAARPFTEEFAAWIATVTGNWAADARGNFEGLQDAIGRGVDVAKQLGDIFGNLWDSIKNVGEAAQPAGQRLLDAFDRATQAFVTFTSSGDGQTRMQEFFDNTSTNFEKIASLALDVGKEFLKLGENQSIGKIADILRTDVLPVLSELLNTLSETSGPAMAELVSSVLGAFQTLAESGGLEAFINTLKNVVDAFGAIVNAPGIKELVPVIGGLVGSFWALDFAMRALKIKAIAENFGSLMGALKNSKSRLQDFGTTLKGTATFINTNARATAVWTVEMIKNAAASTKQGLATAAATAKTLASAAAQKIVQAATVAWTAVQRALNLVMSMNPIGLIITAIGLLVAAFIYLWNNSEAFRNFFIGMWEGIQTAAAAVGAWFTDTLAPWFQGVWDSIRDGLQAVGDFFSTTWNNIVGFVQSAWNLLVTAVQIGLQTYLNVITTVFNTIWAFIQSIWNGIVSFFVSVWIWISDAVESGLDFVYSIVTTIFNNVSAFIKTIWDTVVNNINMAWQVITNTVSSTVASIWTVITDVFNRIRNTIKSILNEVVSIFVGIWIGIRNTALSIIGDMYGGIVGAWNRIVEGISGAVNGLSGIISRAFSGLLGIVRGPINGVINLVNSAVRALNRVKVDVPSWVPGIGGSSWGINIPTIPQLAKGGTVKATQGGVLANIAEAGRDERVTPLNASGMSNFEEQMIALMSSENRDKITINVYAQPGMDVDAIANEVSRRIAFGM